MHDRVRQCNANGALVFVGLGRGEAVGIEDILKCDDTLKFVNIGATHDGQDFHFFCSTIFSNESSFGLFNFLILLNLKICFSNSFRMLCVMKKLFY